MGSIPVSIGEVFADKYRVDRVLGEGGMGVVVAAHHLELDQTVAIKFLLDDIATNDEGAERFRREARAAAKIQSDHVVRVLDVGVLPSGERYMVMEYMEGRDLSEELADKRTFPVGVATGFILEALDAVGQAHAVGIVHRDLKPANLFLARRTDGSQRIKVLDFGISKSIGSATSEEMSLTKTSAWIGSPLYMAPEQMQSARDVDHRADIWSLGAILYELISGRPPYEAESLPQLCNLLITTDPVPIESLVPAIPEGLAAAIMRCLVRDREQRIQSTAELARVLIHHATSITGSSLRQSLMDQTELQSKVPASSLQGAPSLAFSPSSGSLLSSQEPQGAADATTGPRSAVDATTGPRSAAGVATVSSSTTAGWGATDEGKRTPNGKVGWAVAALLAAGVVGFLVMRPGGDPSEAAEQAPVAAESSPSESKVDPQEAEPPPEAEPEPKEAALVQEPAPDPKPETLPSPPKVQPAPRPPIKPAKAPKKPATEPKKSDDFADFGGRR